MTPDKLSFTIQPLTLSIVHFCAPMNICLSFQIKSSVIVNSSMATTFPAPPVKKPTAAFPPRRGRVKAQIFEGVTETVASAASRAGDFLGFIKKENEGSASAPPPKTTKTCGEDGRTV
ncbi:unnamed protein product [Lactuca saligna]|uniref:Uncharacterized protein n=1 Tax=Lactuca saligna TaxID=75948 RepID=A0AA36EMH2_LACSI|nr:unnamed protein product [Lactuca saligna]